MKMGGSLAAAWLAMALLGACSDGSPKIDEIALDYPDKTPLTPPPGDACNAPVEALHPGSTHEIAFAPDGAAWVSGQNYDSLARVPARDGEAVSFLALPEGAGPHGLAFDGRGRLWVTLEFLGKVRALDPNGRVLADIDVAMPCSKMPGGRTNTRPHGLAVGPDGSLWFTGKATGTLGRIGANGRVTHFALPAGGPASKPIYIHPGPDGAMWATELEGNRIARVGPYGGVSEFLIKDTPKSRPIAIIPGPDGAMWFSEEAGSKIGRIDSSGQIREIAVPRGQPNLILAGLAFDRKGNLWTQQYVDQNNPSPAGTDSLVRIDKAGQAEGAKPGTGITFYPVPTRATVMHRIALAPDGALRFTEMHVDQLGRMMPPR
ncbi:MAG: hypothetical protein ACJ8ER_15920 [Allosphingosinicella sp.]